MHVEWIERRTLALLGAGQHVSLTDEIADLDRVLAEPVRVIDPELAEQRRAMGIAV